MSVCEPSVCSNKQIKENECSSQLCWFQFEDLQPWMTVLFSVLDTVCQVVRCSVCTCMYVNGSDGGGGGWWWGGMRTCADVMW